MAEKKVLLFDLGGVIVPWVGIEALMAHTGMTRESVLVTLARSEIFNAYETGQCGDETFLVEMIHLFNFNMSSQEFSKTWNSWVLPPFPNTLDTLKALKERYTLACLSNTNALHWAHLNMLFNLEAIFDYSFASHLIQVAKPDPLSFQIPLKAMGVTAQQVMFFDDTPINVDTARSEGLSAYSVDRSLGVLPILDTITSL